MNFKKNAVAVALSTTLGMVAPHGVDAALYSSAIYEFAWEGLFTMLDPTGVPLTNGSKPYYYDATWGYGKRTQVSGSFYFEPDTGNGYLVANPFFFFAGDPAMAFHDGVFEAIGDGAGNPGSLMVGSMLFDWNTSVNIPVDIVWDAAGLFSALPVMTTGDTVSGVGALPASNGMFKNLFPIGPAPMATTSFDTDYYDDPSCVTSYTCIVGDDGIGGSLMDALPFPHHNVNLDITQLTLNSIVAPAALVPVPAAVWLFGSGLVGLVGIARRRRRA